MTKIIHAVVTDSCDGYIVETLCSAKERAEELVELGIGENISEFILDEEVIKIAWFHDIVLNDRGVAIVNPPITRRQLPRPMLVSSVALGINATFDKIHSACLTHQCLHCHCSTPNEDYDKDKHEHTRMSLSFGFRTKKSSGTIIEIARSIYDAFREQKLEWGNVKELLKMIRDTPPEDVLGQPSIKTMVIVNLHHLDPVPTPPDLETS